MECFGLEQCGVFHPNVLGEPGNVTVSSRIPVLWSDSDVKEIISESNVIVFGGYPCYGEIVR